MAKRLQQEFYCGNCSGYIAIKINVHLDYEVHVVCPSCKHEHRRCIRKGRIQEQGRYQTDAKEKILVTMAAYSKKPRTPEMAEKHAKKRDGVLMDLHLPKVGQHNPNAVEQAWAVVKKVAGVGTKRS